MIDAGLKFMRSNNIAEEITYKKMPCFTFFFPIA